MTSLEVVFFVVVFLADLSTTCVSLQQREYTWICIGLYETYLIRLTIKRPWSGLLRARVRVKVYAKSDICSLLPQDGVKVSCWVQSGCRGLHRAKTSLTYIRLCVCDIWKDIWKDFAEELVQSNQSLGCSFWQILKPGRTEYTEDIYRDHDEIHRVKGIFSHNPFSETVGHWSKRAGGRQCHLK